MKNALKKRLLLSTGLCLSLLWLAGPLKAAEPAATPANRTELSLMTGRESGTYYQLGRDLRKLAGRHQIDLSVIPSAGSLENIFKVYEYPSLQLGLSQFDSLSLVALEATISDDGDAEELNKLVNSLQLVLPLYYEEVHVLAKAPEIKQLTDLNDKSIAVGDAVSGTYGTATILLDLFKITPAEQPEMDAVTALDALQRGEIDAMIYVVGSPAQLFTGPLANADGLHLVSIEVPDDIAKNELFQTFYKKATIADGTYVWQKQAVPTLSVGTVLFTSNKDQNDESCQAIGQLAKIVYDNLDELGRAGHPKWKSISIDREALLKAPHLSPCVGQAFK
ncbi:MAG TPA: TAXI family TRAP transporter solute-binding subunit [Candidatus Competibacteraceae bacterium]|nr:TAXI family TRAP transporter solute-binding subunit [Candidatus Competibacteraceae bacterium]HPF57453.1 TAXI family TRAP transporter solute-binding subunit [Candidatus Competibacteraceae bacterium]HRY17159.1 TAXI family TRAP transporter solute-binding subunit [Candidatus Competibacteraceae bacterium]